MKVTTRAEQNADRRNVIYLVAEIDDEVVGYARCEEMGRAQEVIGPVARYLAVDQIFVDAAARGKGAALALMEEAARLARSRGLEKVEVAVLRERDRAGSAFDARVFDKLMEKAACGLRFTAD